MSDKLTDHLDASRVAVAVLTALHAGDALKAARAVSLITDPELPKYVAALQSLGVQFLNVIDAMSLLIADLDGPQAENTNARALLGTLAEQMALADSIDV